MRNLRVASELGRGRKEKNNLPLTVGAADFVGGIEAIDVTVAALRLMQANAVGATELVDASASFWVLDNSACTAR